MPYSQTMARERRKHDDAAPFPNAKRKPSPQKQPSKKKRKAPFKGSTKDQAAALRDVDY